ncbi:Sb-PDE family phosphodiesterase [Spongiimicrobium sp. 3-5]|uniref:Sb-PDE family phosphodiesterase n=1 Tax=Spongiimicrobium sp. 3-5 TaxID=3332596 RepID=UPI003980F08C
MKRITTLLLCLLAIVNLSAQSHSHTGPGAITYPNIEGYITLKADLHQHTVFSDGNVWPRIRVMEALRDSLDVISLTEHLEYQPHIDDIPHPDRNRSFKLALAEAKDHNLLVVHGTEITRQPPAGHSNAIFITDANPMLVKDSVAAFAEAKKQGAFVFWNHPAWYPQSRTGNPILSDFQKDRIKNNELHGIEVINSKDYAEESLALALEHNLTIMGTSDVHDLITWDYTQEDNHRPITLIFAKEKSEASIREALFQRRTVAAYNDLLVGRPEFLNPLLQSCIQITKASYIPDSDILEVVLRNVSSSDLLFENAMPYTFYSRAPIFEAPAKGTVVLQIKTLERMKAVDLRLKALRAYTAPKTQPTLSWDVTVE